MNKKAVVIGLIALGALGLLAFQAKKAHALQAPEFEEAILIDGTIVRIGGYRQKYKNRDMPKDQKVLSPALIEAILSPDSPLPHQGWDMISDGGIEYVVFFDNDRLFNVYEPVPGKKLTFETAVDKSGDAAA